MLFIADHVRSDKTNIKWIFIKIPDRIDNVN